MLYAREGAHVVLVDNRAQALRETATIIRQEGGTCEPVVCDVSSSEQVRAMVERACEAFGGRVDVLHNNVGIAVMGDAVTLSEDDWDRVQAVNLKSMFLTCKYVIPIMARQGAGAIVNVSSIAGIRSLPGGDYLSYYTTKGAVLPFTRTIAVQYARQGIRANAVLPGLMDTPMVEALGEAYADTLTGGDREKMRRYRAEVIPMDENGYFNFGPSVTYLKALTERAKTLIVETSPSIPHVMGTQEAVHASEVDFVIEGDGRPLVGVANPETSEVDRRIARLIAAEIEDGSCLQIGIGGMPNAVCSMLKDSGIRDLGVHSEMLVDGLLDLHEAGLVTGARKQIDQGTMVFTFVQTQRLYEFIHRNPAVRSYPVDYTNLPANIARNDRVISINTTMQVDLQGQAASESNGHRHISGTGGQLQFVRGAYASKGGKSFLCLSSVYERHGRRQSRIVTSLPSGSIVTTPRTDVMYVVTEYGIANLKGLSIPERANALIGLAHPDFREELSREARELKLTSRAFW